MSNVDVSQLPTNGPSTPASGRYGEATALANLKKALPVGQAGGAPPAGATPPAPDVPAPPVPTPGAPASRLPEVLTRPTMFPGRSVNTPFQPSPPNPVAMAQTEAQKRLALLDALSTSDKVSDETREWAKAVLDAILRSGA